VKSIPKFWLGLAAALVPLTATIAPTAAADKPHGGLGIKASEFDIVVQHLVDTLNKFNVPEKEHEELLVIIGTLRPDIVEVEDK
jgi:hypothetical protein